MPTQYRRFENPMDDGRRKLHPDKHQEIIVKFHSGVHRKALALEYGVSESLIKVVISPTRQKSLHEWRKRSWRNYANRITHTIAIRKMRLKKRLLGLVVKRTKKPISATR